MLAMEKDGISRAQWKWVGCSCGLPPTKGHIFDPSSISSWITCNENGVNISHSIKFREYLSFVWPGTMDEEPTVCDFGML